MRGVRASSAVEAGPGWHHACAAESAPLLQVATVITQPSLVCLAKTGDKSLPRCPLGTSHRQWFHSHDPPLSPGSAESFWGSWTDKKVFHVTGKYESINFYEE